MALGVSAKARGACRWIDGNLAAAFRWCRPFCYRGMQAVEAIGVLLVAGIAGALRVEGDGYWTARLQGVGGLLRWLQVEGRDAAPVIAVALACAAGSRRLIGPPWTWSAMQRVLDKWRASAFSDVEGEVHYHRVTLFRVRRLGRVLTRWPWTRVAFPVLRSGHLTQNMCSSFRAPDDGDRSEGVAGMAFAASGAVHVDELPDVSGLDATDADVLAYATKTKMSVAQVRERRPQARSFYATVVEVRGKRWGVVVLDSRDPGRIGNKAGSEFESYVLALTLLLERRA